MAGLVPAIHVFFAENLKKTWMPATSAGMTKTRTDPGITFSQVLALATGEIPPYSSGFNDIPIEIDLRPRSPASAGYRGTFRCRYHRPARPLRGICRAQPPDRQKAHLAAGTHAGKSVFRGLDPDPILV